MRVWYANPVNYIFGIVGMGAMLLFEVDVALTVVGAYLAGMAVGMFNVTDR